MPILRQSPRMVRRLKWLSITLVVIVALMIGQSFAWRGVRALAANLRDRQSQVQQVEELRLRVEATKKDYEKQQASLEQLTVVVPLGRDTIQVLERLESVATQAGVVVEVVGIKEGEPLWSDSDGASVFPLSVAVKLTGSPSQLLGYVEKMEHVQELMQVESLGLVAGGEGLFTLNMEVKFYLQKLNEDDEG